MSYITIESTPTGASLKIDGSYYGITPVDVEVDVEPVIPEGGDMVVFVSPQYQNDDNILAAIKTYATAVKDDIGWDVTTVKVDPSKNRYDEIDAVIKGIHRNDPLKACLMVGEDMSNDKNVLTGSTGWQCSQSIVPWATLDGVGLSTICTEQVVVTPIHIHIPISLMYPNERDTYATKKSQIITAFNKFSVGRDKTYPDDCVAFVAEEMEEKREDATHLRTGLSMIGDPEVIIEAEHQTVVEDALVGEYKAVAAAGHAHPSSVSVARVHVSFRTRHSYTINTPFILVSGCNSYGWSVTAGDHTGCKWYQPMGEWFGHSIFNNPNLRVMLSGFPIGRYAQVVPPYNPSTSFVCTGGFSKMSIGMTVAEALKDVRSQDSAITMYGDPTFHF